jgi:hypothetical protein
MGLPIDCSHRFVLYKNTYVNYDGIVKSPPAFAGKTSAELRFIIPRIELGAGYATYIQVRLILQGSRTLPPALFTNVSLMFGVYCIGILHKKKKNETCFSW